MPLTTEMMDILINEYFTDPLNIGYRKYGRLDDNKFYLPQIAYLLNDSRPLQYHYCDSDDNHKSVSIPNYYPPRIAEIFAGLEGAPNQITGDHILQTFLYFAQLNPEQVNDLILVQE